MLDFWNEIKLGLCNWSSVSINKNQKCSNTIDKNMIVEMSLNSLTANMAYLCAAWHVLNLGNIISRWT